MPRAPSGLSLLLMAGLAFAATSPLQTVNPWLSASELQSAAFAASQQRPGCSPPRCPPPCPANSTKSTQCLYYLEESHKEEVCGNRDLAIERRRDLLHGLRMRHCCEHAVDAALPLAAFEGGTTCRRHLAALIEVDHLASRLSCAHADLLIRYDCAQNYSIAHDCNNCKEAYRRWVCSSLVPHYKTTTAPTTTGAAAAAADEERVRIRPCLSVCEDVEQQCPYLLPDQTVQPGEAAAAHPTPQYAGEPTFLCLDPNIPESGEQRLKSPRGDEDCCYTHCGAPGRGGATTTTTTTISADQGDGGGRRRPEILGVCEHCPGRPPNATGTKQAHPSGPEAPSRGARRTFNKVFLLWTAWITLLHTDRLIYYETIQCLLVMCAISVRTPLCWLKTKWRHSCS